MSSICSISESDDETAQCALDLEEVLDYEMEEALQSNRGKLIGERKVIIPGTRTYTNSLNVIVGKQNRGKTHTGVRECIKICRSHPHTHLLVYINRNGEQSDGTFEALKLLIPVPIKYVSQDEAIDYLKNLLEYKQVYNQIISEGLTEQVPPQCREELFDALFIRDFNHPFLHTIVLTDDASKMKCMKSDEFSNLLTQCRHIQCTFFINIHFFKALSTTIKTNIDTLYICSGFSRQQISYILYQSNVGIGSKELWDTYSRLGQFDKLVIDSETSDVSVV